MSKDGRAKSFFASIKQTLEGLLKSSSKDNSKDMATSGADYKESSLSKQWLRAIGGIVLVLLICLTVFKLVTGSYKSKKSYAQKEVDIEQPIKIETANKALDPETMWRNHFDEKLNSSDVKLAENLNLIKKSFSDKEKELEATTKAEFEAMRQQLAMARSELQEAVAEIKALDKSKDEERIFAKRAAEYSTEKFEGDYVADVPKSSRNFIPETAYMSGTILNGIAVSTSMGSSSEPVPIVIRITKAGSLPKNFEQDVKECKILGSTYGDLSSERAVIRLETMSCTNKKTETVTTTKVAGLVYGDDGMNGVKGRVVQTSQKHINNAIMGGFLSGLAQTAKQGEQFSLSGAGAFQTKKQGFGSKLKDNSLAGVGGAGEKIADYYLRQAEAMSPVLIIPGGTKVDIVFTKGVYLGSLDMKSRLKEARSEMNKETD